ncbi:MAG: flagellar assembly protein FliW [Oscillospiraceae bacterium]
MTENIMEKEKINISKNDILQFPDGIPGFENVKEYILICHDDENTIFTLQNANGNVPQFVVIDPFAFLNDYNPILLADFQNAENLKYLVIAVVKENYKETTVNLKVPIVINADNNVAYQVILDNDDYSMKYPLFKEMEGC